jgi:hypothetical protein
MNFDWLSFTPPLVAFSGPSGGENGITSKMILKLKCLSPLKMLTSPLFEETFGASLFFFFFLSLFFSSVS